MDIIEILQFVADNTLISSVKVSRVFNISKNDAAVRLNKLWKSGQIRKIKQEATYPYQYEITDFGKDI
jgi:predicted transcriptional regulator